MPERIKLVEAAALEALLRNPSVVASLSWLAPYQVRLKAARKSGGCCGGRRTPDFADAMNNLKQAIASASQADLNVLKRWFKADRLRLTIMRGGKATREIV